MALFLNLQKHPENMQINFKNQLDSSAQALLIPIAAGEALESQLEQIASRWNMDLAGIQSHFKAESGELLPLFANQQTAFLLGLGNTPGYAETLKTVRSFAHKQ